MKSRLKLPRTTRSVVKIPGVVPIATKGRSGIKGPQKKEKKTCITFPGSTTQVCGTRDKKGSIEKVTRKRGGEGTRDGSRGRNYLSGEKESPRRGTAEMWEGREKKKIR